MPSRLESETPIGYDIVLPYVSVDEDADKNMQYPEYMPNFDDIWFDPLKPFHYEDPALRVEDKSLPNLLKSNVKLTPIQPRMGMIAEGIQLGSLSDQAKDELACLIAEHKVVAFPDQDLINAGPAAQQKFMDYFGKPNYQPVSGTVRGHPGFHIIHRDGNKEDIARFMEARLTSNLWHQDVSYEIQPPGYVMLGLLNGPSVGGDTVFASTGEAYRRLSPAVRAFLDSLSALHTSSKMIAHVKALGGRCRKDPIDTIHPLVRVHPVTGERCLFLNGEFITKIVGLKEPESKMLTDFLLNYMMMGHDFQARVRWAPGTIVMFDNRSLIHSAIVDYIDDEGAAKLRHIFRLCAMAEKPISVAEAEQQFGRGFGSG
ncbi:Nn.00g053600.m01.CDS01 [Neocucurbitaria sp. VM-36]